MKMNLYKVKTERANSQHFYNDIEYVVGESLEDIGRTYPKADGIELIQKDIKILK